MWQTQTQHRVHLGDGQKRPFCRQKGQKTYEFQAQLFSCILAVGTPKFSAWNPQTGEARLASILNDGKSPRFRPVSSEKGGFCERQHVLDVVYFDLKSPIVSP
jgi:hypothetical protein